MISYFPVVTGSLVVLGNISVSGSINTSGSITISGSITSASFASTASFVALAQSASNAVSAATASSADNLLVRNTLTAQTLVVQTITSSVDFVTGSTRFGSLIGNTHVFTGSVSITGSNTLVGDLTLSGNRSIFLSNSNPAAGAIRFYNSTSGSTKSAIGSYFNVADEGNLEFIAGGTNTKMIITSAGNVGIATTTIPNNLGVALQMGSTVNFMSYVGNAYFLNNWYYDSSGNAKYITSNFASGITQNGSGELRFFTNPSGTANATFTPTERLMITNGGNVLIGTTTDNTGKLQVNGEIRMYGSTLFRGMSSNTLQLCGGTSSSNVKIDGSTETITMDTNGATRLTISSTGAASFASSISAGNISMAQFYASAVFSSYTGDGLFNASSRYCSISTPGAADRIRFGYNDYGSGQYWGRIGFFATTNWSLGIITGAGNDFSIGTGYQGSQLYIYSNGNYAFSGSNVSDRRKKSNINYITSNQLDNILKLKPATFNKIADEVVSENIHTGFIAQDIMEEGIPNLVMGSDEGGYGLDYDGILALTVKALQELKAEFDEYKATHP